jgi:hypothetical protein
MALPLLGLVLLGAFHSPLTTRSRVRVSPRPTVRRRPGFDDSIPDACEWDIEGIIWQLTSTGWATSGVEWIGAQIDMYDRVYPNLRKHADGFPTAQELKSKVYVGNISSVGEMDQDTPGADRIVSVLLDDKPGRVYLQAWGGTNTIAKALATIQREHPDQIAKVSQKAVIYIILDQDLTFRSTSSRTGLSWRSSLHRQFAVIAYN